MTEFSNRPEIPNKRSRQTAQPKRIELRQVDDVPLVPARILNEYVYCPRLAYLEWVQKEWASSADTVEGQYVHRRVDSKADRLAGPEDLEDVTAQLRSIELSSERLHLTAKLDLLEVEGGKVLPVDYKRGRRPHVKNSAYDPERVQLCAQALLLREHGYVCTEGVLYYAQSKERVFVQFDDELIDLTLASLGKLLETVKIGKIPQPLVDSPKCPRCSLIGICLPDELNYERQEGRHEIRPLNVKRSNALPVYVQSYRGKVAKDGYRLSIATDDQDVKYVRLNDVSHLVVMGNIYITTPTLHELMRREIPVSWMSYGGWLLGHSIGTGHANVELRTAQYAASFDSEKCLQIARWLVASKIKNSRTLLRRNTRKGEQYEADLSDLARLARKATSVSSMQTLLGVEGASALSYFNRFDLMLKENDAFPSFLFNKRNRRPPVDPVNAMLSFGYSLLTSKMVSVLSAVGFDPYRGFFHQPRYGRPALALDLMEPFRSLIVDSVVITVINNSEIHAKDFVKTSIGVNLTKAGRRKFIAAFERRLDIEVTHPIFGYRIDYRRLLELQSRLLGRYLLGEIQEYPTFETR